MEDAFQRGIDDGVLELRVLKAMAAADFAKIVEPDRQRNLARLHLFAAQLSDEPRCSLNVNVSAAS